MFSFCVFTTNLDLYEVISVLFDITNKFSKVSFVLLSGRIYSFNRVRYI